MLTQEAHSLVDLWARHRAVQAARRLVNSFNAPFYDAPTARVQQSLSEVLPDLPSFDDNEASELNVSLLSFMILAAGADRFADDGYIDVVLQSRERA